MDLSDPQISISLGVIIAVSSLIYTWLKIGKIAKKGREEHEAKILQAAKEADSKMKIELEAKIENLDKGLKNLELNVNKDIAHLKEAHNSEIRNLGEKIEELRSELRNQHGQLVALLTKMIDNKD